MVIESLRRCDHDEDEFNGLCYTKCGWASGCFDFKLDSMGFHGDFMGINPVVIMIPEVR